MMGAISSAHQAHGYTGSITRDLISRSLLGACAPMTAQTPPIQLAFASFAVSRDRKTIAESSLGVPYSSGYRKPPSSIFVAFYVMLALCWSRCSDVQLTLFPLSLFFLF